MSKAVLVQFWLVIGVPSNPQHAHIDDLQRPFYENLCHIKGLHDLLYGAFPRNTSLKSDCDFVIECHLFSILGLLFDKLSTPALIQRLKGMAAK